ncbi:MAG: archaeal proteasome endopeptidase complex subunit beta [Euryarchaeota archaeon]|nr:archaeal proteasome endopeptidase complex subunit beta [Euryarchaeota archaeon]
MDTDQLYKGTTTVGMVCDGGVVLASERRATMGHFIASKTARKIYPIDERMAMTTAGLVGDAQTLVRVLAVENRLYRLRRNEAMSVRAASTLLANILNGNRYFPYYVQLLTGGVDRTGPVVYSIDAAGGLLDEKELVSTGSGSPIAYGVLESQFRPKMAPDEAVELAVKAIHGAMKRDAASGEGIEAVKITQSGGYEDVRQDAIQKIRSRLS